MFPFNKWAGRSVSPGSVSYTAPSTYTFVVPDYNTLTVTVRGAGGGGGDRDYANGYSGGNSSFGSATPVVGNGGTGGDGTYGIPATPGGASGPAGTTATTGGGAPSGVGMNYGVIDAGYSGGYGGYAQKTWNSGDAGAPSVGASITVVAGAGGAGSPYNGSDGSVQIAWS